MIEVGRALDRFIRERRDPSLQCVVACCWIVTGEGAGLAVVISPDLGLPVCRIPQEGWELVAF